MKEEGDHSVPAHNNVQDSIAKVEAQNASVDPQPAASCDDERNRETKGKYLKEIKELSSRKLKRPTSADIPLPQYT